MPTPYELRAQMTELMEAAGPADHRYETWAKLRYLYEQDIARLEAGEPLFDDSTLNRRPRPDPPRRPMVEPPPVMVEPEVYKQRWLEGLDSDARTEWREALASTLPIPVTALEAEPRVAVHVLKEEIDRRALATLAWSPWARRRRYHSRRYEGFSR